MQRCRREENSRVVPLLYAAADNAIPHFTAEENDRMKMDYLLCDAAGGGRAASEGEDAQPQEAEEGGSIDVMGVNLFRFCSDSCTYHSCESAAITAVFASSPIPLVLSEFGCSPFIHHVNHSARAGVNPFLEARTLLSPPMSDTWSGGSAYTFGTRGGEQFAFFHGGERELRGRVGTSRSCGWPDGICRIDMYEKELAAAEDRERAGSQRRLEASGGGRDGGGCRGRRGPEQRGLPRHPWRGPERAEQQTGSGGPQLRAVSGRHWTSGH